jgi:hypothetical protein
MPPASLNFDLTSFLLGFTTALLITVFSRNNIQRVNTTSTQTTPDLENDLPPRWEREDSPPVQTIRLRLPTCNSCWRNRLCDQSEELGNHCLYHCPDHCINYESDSGDSEGIVDPFRNSR